MRKSRALAIVALILYILGMGLLVYGSSWVIAGAVTLIIISYLVGQEATQKRDDEDKSDIPGE